VALLKAIASQESNFNPAAVGGVNANGTVDLGLMQINSEWLPKLARFQITEAHLFDPCISADVGGWILADNFRRFGVNWTAVGAYNAVTPHKRDTYAAAVYRRIGIPVVVKASATRSPSVMAGRSHLVEHRTKAKPTNKPKQLIKRDTFAVWELAS
jgi:soluble lytic murein transglycosylase-like protein